MSVQPTQWSQRRSRSLRLKSLGVLPGMAEPTGVVRTTCRSPRALGERGLIPSRVRVRQRMRLVGGRL